MWWKAGCISILILPVLALSIVFVLWRAGFFEHREPRLVTELEPPNGQRIATIDTFICCNLDGRAVLYRTDWSFAEVVHHYTARLIALGYTPVHDFVVRGGVIFTRRPGEYFPPACYYLIPHFIPRPSRFGISVPWSLADQQEFDELAPDYIFAYILDHDFPRAKVRC
ncbi:MAG TPA: hypothetical protein VJ777_05425 [Mycobacterium sp.]|nr:hypothetical protein [Mycobacterium sp.]